MAIGKNTNQINLKLPSKLVSVAEEYADYYGYSNVQELIRDSLREKVFSDEVKEEYINALISSEEKREYLGKEESERFLMELGKKALDYKNAK